jgi:hypothetical protein
LCGEVCADAVGGGDICTSHLNDDAAVANMGHPGFVVSRRWQDFASAGFAGRMTEEQADVAQLVEQLIRNQ